ncbi:transcriptional regulator, BadM/Rrf2 family [Chryseolinea serpens]|uniref:Transcriptional regulator, BadM/Rrf2 family n=1 Tax=Chryseolinea serpens TaxID=947013 RepID=A0A1M5XTZ4_9BACT|nr:Rrf2 family transcriptional regulator [Chryseolinea serpens]SHI03192.1 transcriptional regulator, BadM/Rrf2 family [Chryseolinea serpens]
MLSKKCQYALHALKFMAQHPVGQLLHIKEIASQEHIPKKFLESILRDLKTAGILGSKMGNIGGYYFIKKPSDVTLLEVIRTIDGAVAMLPCVSLNYYQSCGFCEDESTCGINSAFSKVRDETLKILSATTIRDLSPDLITVGRDWGGYKKS